MSETTVIEVNGVKMEVDLRHARRVENITVGTKVKILEKNDYSGQKVHSGVVVGFEPFEALPTIIVCFLRHSYAEAAVEFAYINPSEASRKKWELVVSVDDDIPFEKATVVAQLDRQIAGKQAEIEELERKKAYFLTHFNQYFAEPVATLK